MAPSIEQFQNDINRVVCLMNDAIGIVKVNVYDCIVYIPFANEELAESFADVYRSSFYDEPENWTA